MDNQVSLVTTSTPQTKLQTHTPAPVREMFREAIEVFADWTIGQPEPTVPFENDDITLSRACRLVWECQNPLPGSCMESLAYCDVEPKARTYASAARAMLEAVKARARSQAVG